MPDPTDTDETENPKPWIVESPTLPAVFNAGGRPNRHATKTYAATAADDEDAAVLEGYAFTHDDDPLGKWWSVREAITATLVVWLYGVLGASKARSVMLEAETLNALYFVTGEVGEAYAAMARWQGLDARCPEVSVQGLGVFDAIVAICEAGGFEMACEPVIDQAEPDRRYQLRLWRKGSGPLVNFNLSKRGQAPTDAEAALRANNISKLRGLRDTTPIRNEIFARRSSSWKWPSRSSRCGRKAICCNPPLTSSFNSARTR